MRIALGADHRGDAALNRLAAHLREQGHEVDVFGGDAGHPSDYADYAYLVGEAVRRGLADRGILMCGSGIGMSIAANKVPGVRAALALDVEAATMSRRHNDANVLCLAADRMASDKVSRTTDAWLEADFEGGRHERRIEKIAAIERGEDPGQSQAPGLSDQ